MLAGVIPMGAIFLESYLAMPYHVMIRFGKWDDIIAEPMYRAEDAQIFPAAIATVNCADQASLETQLTDWVNTAGGAMGTDVCSAVSFRADPPLAQAIADFQASQTACGRTGSVNVDFYISDACGTENPMPTTASFNVVDVTDPVWTAGPSDITVECDGTNDPGAALVCLTRSLLPSAS